MLYCNIVPTHERVPVVVVYSNTLRLHASEYLLCRYMYVCQKKKRRDDGTTVDGRCKVYLYE